MPSEINLSNPQSVNAQENLQLNSNGGAVEQAQTHNVPGNISPNSVLGGLPQLEEPRCNVSVAEQLTESQQEARNDSTAYTQKSLALTQALVAQDKESVQKALDNLTLEEGPFTREISELVDKARQFLGLPAREVAVELDDETYEAISNLFNEAPENVQNCSAKELNAKIERLSNALVQPADGAHEDPHGIGALKDVAQAIELVEAIDKVQSQQEADKIIADCDALRTDDSMSVEEKLEKLDQMTAQVRDIQAQKAALAILNDPNASELARVSAQTVLSGAQTQFTPEDIDRITANFEDHCAHFFEAKLLAGEPASGAVQLEVLALTKAVIKNGTSLVAFCNALERGFAAYGMGLPKGQGNALPAYRADLVHVLQAFINEDPTAPEKMRVDFSKAEDRSALLGAVDLIFQSGMPELADEALAVKIALLPSGHKEDARIQQGMMLAHRSLMQTLFDRNPDFGKLGFNTSNDLKEFAAAKMSVGANSMRSFLLTPQTVKEIVKFSGGINIKKRFGNKANHVKEAIGEERDINSVNYKIANLIAIQYKAIEKGLLKVDENFMDLKEWCKSLELNNEMVDLVVERAQALQGKGSELSEELVRLSSAQSLFEKGLSGQEEADAALKVASKSAQAITRKREAKKLARNTPGWDEFVIFNRAVADITSLNKEKDRLTVDPDGEIVLNDDANSKIKDSVQAVFDKISQKAMDGNGEFEEFARVKEEFKSASGQFKKDVLLLKNLNDLKDDYLSLKKAADALESKNAEMKAAKKSINVFWARSKSGQNARIDTAQKVLAFCKINDELHKSDLTEARRNELTQQLDKARTELKGISEKKMRPGNHPNVTPSDDVILGVMRQRAEALIYFAPMQGLKQSQADLDAENIKLLAKAIKNSADDIAKLDKKVEKFIGKAESKQIERTVVASILKVALESGSEPSTVSFNNGDMMAKLIKQLSTWGMPITLDPNDETKIVVQTSPAIEAVVRAMISRYIQTDGTLNTAELQNFRKDSRSRATSSKNKEFISSATRNSEMSKRILDIASKPGMSFVYSRERGIDVNKTAIVKMLKENDFSVRNLGAAGWQIIAKSGFLGKLGGSIGFSKDIGAAKAGANISGSFEGTGVDGIALNFERREDCENLIKALMGNKDNKTLNNEAFKRAFVSASQVQIVRKNGKTFDLSASASFDMDLLKFNYKDWVTGNLGANLSAGYTGDIINTVEQNDRKMTITHRIDHKATMGAVFHYDVKTGEKTNKFINDEANLLKDKTNKLINKIKPLKGRVELKPSDKMDPISLQSVNFSDSLAFTTSFERKIVMDEMGISAETGITKSIKLSPELNLSFGGVLKKGGKEALNILTSKFEDELKGKSDKFKKEVQRILYATDPDDTVSFESKITDEALKKIKAKSMEARAAAINGDQERAQGCREEISKILSDNKSYKPVKIVVKGSSTKQLTFFSSIGFGPAKWVRLNNLMVAKTKDSLEIKL